MIMKHFKNYSLMVLAQVLYSVGAGLCYICAIQGAFAETSELQMTWFTAGFGFLGMHFSSAYVVSKVQD